MIHHVTRITRHLIFWAVIVCALLSLALRVALFYIADYKAELAAKISEVTQLPISIGHLKPHLRGLSPELVLQDLRIAVFDDAGQPAVQLKELRLGINLLHWLASGDAFAASRVSLIGAKIAVIRNLDGSFVIKGLNSSAEPPLWLLQGGKYEILQSEITWQDLQRHGEPVTFNHFDLLLKNSHGGTHHEVHLLSQLPKQYGQALRISASLNGNPFVANDLHGQLYLEGNTVHWDKLIRGHLPDDIHIQSGTASVQLWCSLRNSQPQRLSALIDGNQFELRTADGKTLMLPQINGGISWQRLKDHWRLNTVDLSLAGSAPSTLQAAVYDDGRIAAALQQLDLAALNPLLPWLALDYSTAQLQGQFYDSQLFVEAGAERYALAAHFKQLGNSGGSAIPHFQGLTGEVRGTDQLGFVQFNSRDMSLAVPTLFRNAFTLERLNGLLLWRQTPEFWQLGSRQLELNTPDFHSRSRFSLKLPKNHHAPQLNLSLAFDHFTDISKAKNYYPASIMDKDALAWLDDAFVAGHIPQGQLTVRGDLAQFPYDNGNGRFEVAFDLANTELQYNEQWPHLKNVDASVQFLGNGVTVSIDKGQSDNVQIQQAVVAIPSFSSSNQVLVNGQLSASLVDSLKFLQKTPLRAKADAVTSTLSLTGNTKINLDLGVAMALKDDSRVVVSAQLEDAKLLVKPVNLPVDNVTGTLRFTDQGVYSEQLDGVLMGLPIHSKITSNASATRIDMDGVNNVSNLQRQFSFLRNEFANGVFSYRAVLELPFAASEASRLTLHSDLQGVTLTLPENLAKTSEQKIPLKLDFQLDNSRDLPLKVNYGNLLNAALLIDRNKAQLRAAHLVYGGVETAQIPVQDGLRLDIHQPVFRLSTWLERLNNGAANVSGLSVNEINLYTPQLLCQNHEFGALTLGLKRQGAVWQGQLNSKMAVGQLQIPQPITADSRIKLDMTSLDLTELAQLDLSGQTTVNVNQTENLPLIDISSDKLWWRSVNLGSLKLETERVANGIHFKKLTLRGPNRRIDLSADWLKQNGNTTTQLTGTLEMEGFGQFLSDLKFTDEIKETRATLRFDGGWRGAPHDFSLAKVNGKLGFHLKDGRIASIEPGFGRLLGLIAMEQWAKRLSLDFSDVYKKGLAFDDITGSFKIIDGLAKTDDLLIDAVAARMRIVGEVNLADKTLNQQVAVAPKSSDALPIAGTIVGGVASVITQIVTGDDKEGYFFGSEYQLSGHWGDVQVTPLRDQDGLISRTWHGLTDFSWLKGGTDKK